MILFSLTLFKKMIVPYLCFYKNIELDHKQVSLEHVVPKSFLKNVKGHKPASNLHNLFIADVRINRDRSNYYFCNDEVLNELDVDTKKRIFCPPVRCRGTIARVCMYMKDIYDCEVPLLEKDLDEWYTLPLSYEEVRHHELCSFIQGNDNHHISKRMKKEKIYYLD